MGVPRRPPAEVDPAPREPGELEVDRAAEEPGAAEVDRAASRAREGRDLARLCAGCA